METIHGKMTREMSAVELVQNQYERTLVDLGTGDGKFVLNAAKKDPGLFALGIDACRENLKDASRGAPANALFVIAPAQFLPGELNGLASRLTINFPWGSLLESLLCADPALLEGLVRLARPGAQIEVRLNASAAQEAGYALESAAQAAVRALRLGGFEVKSPAALRPADLRALPTSWARRLAAPYRMGDRATVPALEIRGKLL